MDLGLTGQVALVVAASKGLGRASAAAPAAEGANVVIAARNREVLEQAAQEIRQASKRTIPRLSCHAPVTKGPAEQNPEQSKHTAPRGW